MRPARSMLTLMLTPMPAPADAAPPGAAPWATTRHGGA